MAGAAFGDVRGSLFVAEVGVSLFVAGATFGDVAVSLVLAGAIFGDVGVGRGHVANNGRIVFRSCWDHVCLNRPPM